MATCDDHIGQAIRPALLGALLALSGCAALDPIILSAPLTTSQYAESDYYGDLPVVLNQVNQLSFELQSAVKSETSLSNKLGAWLIFLSGGAAVASMSGGATNTWMPAVAAVGAGSYAYGSAFLSKPRLSIYQEGAKALDCAADASRPLVFRRAFIEGPSCAEGDCGFRPAVRELMNSINQARRAVDASLALVKSRQTELAARDARVCAVASVPQSMSSIGTDPADASLLSRRERTNQERVPRACVPGKKHDRMRTAALAIIQTELQSYHATISKADTLSKVASQLLAHIDNAGTRLRAAARQILGQVNADVLKLQPDLNSILQSLGGMRTLGFPSSRSATPKDGAPAAAERAGPRVKEDVLNEEAIRVKLAEARDSVSRMTVAESVARSFWNIASPQIEESSRLLKSCKSSTATSQAKILLAIEKLALAEEDPPNATVPAVDQGNPNMRTAVSKETQQELCRVYKLGGECLASPKVKDCRQRLGQDVTKQIGQQEAEQVIETRKNGICDA
ncbi:MAG: hypothetical protein IPK02_09975 [Candidatus Accumulibacter sp.]|uniref:Uncharacterized protein n=1 Tax=Candidatus Accumulibacter affinis TaxID=2954384 RepID=A0A935W3M9_9PROT|nr:hypothetical protein [Candidatus Accumulibacter affinis]